MYLAIVAGKIATATPKKRGICPSCGDSVLSKCGDIKMWHWAHEVDSGCVISDREPETVWHRSWKKQVPLEWCERVFRAGTNIKRADIVKPTTCPIVYEFQHSPIAPEEIHARENFYLNIVKCGLVWVFDISMGKTYSNGSERLHVNPGGASFGDRISFFWENGRKSILETSTQLYLDLGGRDGMILVSNFHANEKFSGFGLLLSRKEFILRELLAHLPTNHNDSPSEAYNYFTIA